MPALQVTMVMTPKPRRIQTLATRESENEQACIYLIKAYPYQFNSFHAGGYNNALLRSHNMSAHFNTYREQFDSYSHGSLHVATVRSHNLSNALQYCLRRTSCYFLCELVQIYFCLEICCFFVFKPLGILFSYIK